MSRIRSPHKSKPGMHHITAKSSSTEVQNAAGHDRTAWRRFLRITAEEGQHIVTKYGLKGSWRDFENNLQRELRMRVNERLAREDIPQVTEKIIDWRMAQVMKDRKATKTTTTTTTTAQPRAPSSETSASSLSRPDFSPSSRQPSSSSVHSSPGLAHVEAAAATTPMPRGQLPLPGGFLAVNAKPPPPQQQQPSMPIKMVTFDGPQASPSPPTHPAVVRQQQTTPQPQHSPQMQPQMPPHQHQHQHQYQHQPQYQPQYQPPPPSTAPPTEGAPPSPPVSHSRTPSDPRGARFDPIRGWVSN